MAGIGLAIGLAVALGPTRLLSSLLFGISDTGVTPYIVAPAVLAMVALVACSNLARRASRLDPMTVMRAD